MTNERNSAFKVGFLKKIAEAGYTPDEFFALLKQAVSPTDVINSGTSFMGGLGGALSTGGKTLGALALGAPIVAGGALGAADAAINAPAPEDIEHLRKAEMIGLLRRLTTEVNDRQKRIVR